MHGCWQLLLEGSPALFSPTHPAADLLSWAAMALAWILPLEATSWQPSRPHHTACTVLITWYTWFCHTLEIHAFTPASRQEKGVQNQHQKSVGTPSIISLCFEITQSDWSFVSASKRLEIHSKFGWGAHIPAPEHIYFNLSMCQCSFLFQCLTPNVFVGI